MDGVIISPESIIHHPNGEILHAMKSSSNGFCGFGEAYFSKVIQGQVKGWKMHNKMTLNLLVPIGRIEFAVYDGSDFFSTVLSPDNYHRLSIKPKLWPVAGINCHKPAAPTLERAVGLYSLSIKGSSANSVGR